MNLNKTTLANAFALTTCILWILCSAFVWVFPKLSVTITEAWMHGFSLASVVIFNPTLNNFILGGVTLVASAWISGYLLGWSLEFLRKRK